MKLTICRSLAVFACLLPILQGCKPDAAVKQGAQVGRGNKTPGTPSDAVVADAINNPGPTSDVTQFGEIKGVVHFNGKPPARVKIDMSMDPACNLKGGENLSEQILAKDGKLANVFIFLRGVRPSQLPAGSPPVIMDQQGCRYIPHVLALQQGGYVEFRNSDPTMHNIHTMPATVGNETVDVSQGPRGQPQVRQFKSAELMMPVRCNNHPWMNAFINVADSPYFALSDADGNFTISGVPPGTYTIAAVHEKLGQLETRVTVPAKETAPASFTFNAR